MNTFHRLASSLFLAVTLAGCVASPARNHEAQEVAYLLDSYGRLASQPLDEQRHALLAAEREYEKQPGEMQRLQLALAFTLPNVPWRDDKRALQLVEDFPDAHSEAASPRRGLAVLIQQILADRLRLLHEERAVHARLQNAVVEKQRQLQEERRRTDALQHKLDALLAIDREARRRTLRK